MQYKTASSCPLCVASEAVDRDTQTCARLEEIGTNTPDSNTWWYVDLGGIYNVYDIRIQFKDYGEMYSKYSNVFEHMNILVSTQTNNMFYRYNIVNIIFNLV